ncbi:MAG TPA: hypothetical protein VM658_08795 [bacterium]|nr:hypothetical protein [bacterium]
MCGKKVGMALLVAAVMAGMAVMSPGRALGDTGQAAGAEAGKDPLARFTAEQKQKLLAGEPVYIYTETSAPGGSGKGFGQAFIIINAPVETCFKIFGELGKQHEYFPRKTKSEVVKSEGNHTLVHNEFDFYLAAIEYYSLYTIDADGHRFDFEMDKSHPHNVEESAGYFVFEKIDGRRTLFTYAATRLDVGVSVPGFIKELIVSRDLPAQAVNVKKRIESGGKWKDK